MTLRKTYEANERKNKQIHASKVSTKNEVNFCFESESKSTKSSITSSTKSSITSSTMLAENDTKIPRTKLWHKGYITLVFLLGLTWFIGFMMIADVYQIASYTFIVLTSLQGFFIFLSEIVLNDKSRQIILKFLCRKFGFDSF